MKLIARYTKCIITNLNHLFLIGIISHSLYFSQHNEKQLGLVQYFFFPLTFMEQSGSELCWKVPQMECCHCVAVFFGFGYGFFFVSLWKFIGVLLSLPFEEEFWLIDKDVGVLTGEDRGDVILESHQQRESECLAFWLKKAHVLEQVI